MESKIEPIFGKEILLIPDQHVTIPYNMCYDKNM